MPNAGLDEAQAGIKIVGRNINNLRYADDTTLTAESEGELKSLLMKVKEHEKVGLKLNVQKTKIIASGPMTSWEIDGETVDVNMRKNRFSLQVLNFFLYKHFPTRRGMRSTLLLTRGDTFLKPAY